MKTQHAPLGLVLLIGIAGGIWGIARQPAELTDEGRAKIIAAVPEAAPAAPAKPRKVLVYSVTRGFRHASIPWGKAAFEEMGRRTGAFEAVVSDDLDNFEAQTLAGFDAVVFNNTTQEVFLPTQDQLKEMSEEDRKAAFDRDARLKKNLLEWVRNGGGLVGIHAATDTFYKWPEFGAMIGGYFDGHPWNANHRVVLRVEKPDHPLNAPFSGIETFDLVEEIYQFRAPYKAGRQDVLLRMDKETDQFGIKGVKRDDKDFPVAWLRTHGKGRIFYSALGHNTHIYEDPRLLGHFLAGLQWAIGDLDAPPPPGDD